MRRLLSTPTLGRILSRFAGLRRKVGSFSIKPLSCNAIVKAFHGNGLRVPKFHGSMKKEPFIARKVNLETLCKVCERLTYWWLDLFRDNTMPHDAQRNAKNG